MLQGKTAIVTGSTSGIGLAIATSLAAQGCNVMLNGFGAASDIANTVGALATKHGVKVEHHPANMAEPDQIVALLHYTALQFGSVDIIVNNAGIQHTDSVEDFPAEKWDSILAINLSAVFHLTKAAIPGMKQRNWGRIINIASVHGLVGSTQKAAYVAAKHGVLGLTKVVALETAEHNITCNAICPGWVRTPLVEAQIDALAQRDGIDVPSAATKLLEEKQPSKKFVEVDQIGALTVFLCSDAGANITGVAMPIDGGWTAR
jgi:3-hydroxybutyrate dehydrogenase